MKRVLVAMSGGVDSAVAAALLVRQGHDVAGVTFKLFCYGEAGASEKACCGLEGVRDAQASARRLGIPHVVLDLSELFRERVYDDFAREYANGRTPNPCVQCNTHVKFTPLLAWAEANGYDTIATGHYVRRIEREIEGRRHSLLARAQNLEKDQSYVLWGVPSSLLDRCLFPLGELSKPEVREVARELGLPVWDKGESQDICFVDERGYVEVLRESLGEEHPMFLPGEIQDGSGRVLGHHTGLAHFTVGQRRGLGLGGGDRLHVIAIETSTNVLRVGRESELAASGLWASDLNLFVSRDEVERAPVEAKIRYRHQPADAVARWEGERLSLEFSLPQQAVAPGQSCVLYRDGAMLGGGRIAEARMLPTQAAAEVVREDSFAV